MKRIIILSILLLLTMGVVSADDSADGLNQTDIQVPQKIWKDGESNITIDACEATDIDISGAVTYNATLSPGRTSIPIKDLSTGKHSIYINSSNSIREYNITVLKENPDWNMDFEFLSDGEILYGPPYDHEYIDSALIIKNMPEGLSGNFSFYINKELYSQWSAEQHSEEPQYFGQYYEPKSYNFTLKYSGDDYFHPASKSQITVFCPHTITIPEEVILGYDDTIYINSDYDFTNATATIKINNRTVYRKENVNSDMYYHLEYRLNNLEANREYDIEVSFTSDYFNITKNKTVKVYDHLRNYVTFMGKYDYSQDNFKYVYGDESNLYYILAPKLALNITIDGKGVISTYDGECHVVNIGDLAFGTHQLGVSYAGDKKYAKNTFTSEFEVVSRAECSAEVDQNDPNYFTLKLPEDAVGNITIDLKRQGDAEFGFYKKVEVKGSMKVDLPTDHVGEYQFRAYFNGNYELNEIAGQYFVNDFATWIIDDDFWYASLNEPRNLSLKLPEDGFGNLTIMIKKYGKDYQNYTVEVRNGTCSVKLPTDHIGEYTIETSFTGNYELLSFKRAYNIDSDYYISCPDEYLTYNSKVVFSLELPKDGIGTLTVEMKHGKDGNYSFYKSVELENGSASIQLPTDRIEKTYYNVLYNGNYELYNITDYEVTTNPTYSFKNSIITLIADEMTNGTLTITDWNTYDVEVKVVNGSASIDLTEYRKQIEENIDLNLNFVSSNGERYDVGYECITPIYDIKIVSNNLIMYYGDAKVFKAKIYRNNKIVGKGKRVVVKIGNRNYYLTTDKNGMAQLRITQTPKTYAATIKYKTKTKSNRITVKRILALKAVKVKKSARQIVLTATLKKGKTAVKGKVITFRFNGKILKSKTNRYGVAKVTVKKTVLNRLKAGRTITYSATYIKDTIKRTAKVFR